MTHRLHRRAFLQSTALTLPFLSRGVLLAADPDLARPGLIAREREPQNLEMNFATLDRPIVPTERFYVRNHFAVPALDLKTWKLKVEGAVERPFEIGYDELRKLGSRTQTALLECAGNGRMFLTPKVRGVAWDLGAVGNAEWTGVSLAALLERAGVKKEAVEVVLEGADTGAINDDPKSPGAIHFTRSLPLERARRPEVLLAWGMNGKDLTPNHGWPLRAVVPGWYGVSAVKWLQRLVVLDQPFAGFFQKLDYTLWERKHGLPTLVPITELEVKSAIARPSAGEIVPAGKPFRVFGAAWTGDSEITKVEISTDAGKTWNAAKLLDKPVRHAWSLWEYDWRTPTAGKATLLSRATDARGRTQPFQRDPDRRTYLISHVLPIDVEVR